MAGIIALVIEKGKMITKINLQNLTLPQLAMVSSQLRILDRTILNVIEEQMKK